MENPVEENFRAAISRYYYGFFGVLRRYLINVKHKYYLKGESPEVHKWVYEELSTSGDLNELTLARFLDKLRVARNNADYDEQCDLKYFNEFWDELDSDFEICFDALKYLIKHPNY